ncbi:hypothetical protein FJY90_03745, partial [Candidatus Gottesmanbacteria bacterium]|nr:hypothetical protein [Candidatus Gottesmanbacteria bacterium]
MTKKIRGKNSPACSIKFLSFLFILFFILSFITSKEALPADENNNNSDPQNAIPSLPDSGKKDKSYKTVTINAGPNGKVIFFTGKNLGIAHGNAVVKYEDVILKADHVWADLDKEVLEAEGNVRLETKDQNVTAKHLLFDLKNKKGLIIDGVSFDDPWYNSGKEMTRFDAQNYFIRHGGMTSCSLEHPHYSFEASQIVIHLKKEIIAKHVILKIGGVPLMYLPVYRRSLEEDKPARFIFRIGSNTFEGYYVKNALPIRWRMLDGSLFFDYTTRRGNRGGTEFDYDANKLKLREIFIPVPKDASGKEWQEAREKIDDILQRAKGEMDKVWLKQIFVKYKIEEADKEKARKEAQEVLEKCREKDADFGQQARRWSDDKLTKSNDGFLGYFVKDEKGVSKKEGDKLTPVKPDMLPVIEAAFTLQPDQISDIGEIADGFFIVKRSPESYTGQGYRVNWIFIEFESSQKAKEIASEKADEILTKISEGTSFEEMAKLHSDDEKTREDGGDLEWKTFQEIDISFHNAIRIITKGEVSRPIITNRGIYILKLMDKEKTPDFKDLAKEYSKAPNAEIGGDMGYRNKWEIPPEIRREAYRLELFGISTPIRSEDGYRIIKVEKKSRLGGDVYVEYGDLYSYQIEKNPIKLGQTWNINIHHNQTLWRSGEQLEEETMTRQERLRMQKSLGMRAELSLAGRQYKKLYTSYSPEQELRSYCAFDYFWTSKTGSSGNARLMIDGTKDLLGTDKGRLQKYPDFGFRSPNYLLGNTQPFKKVNSGLSYISDRIQGRANFADLARE